MKIRSLRTCVWFADGKKREKGKEFEVKDYMATQLISCGYAVLVSDGVTEEKKLNTPENKMINDIENKDIIGETVEITDKEPKKKGRPKK